MAESTISSGAIFYELPYTNGRALEKRPLVGKTGVSGSMEEIYDEKEEKNIS